MYLRGKDRSKKRRSVVRSLLHGIASAISYGAALLLLITLLSPYVSPSVSRILPLLGLAAPWIYITTLALAMFWIIRWQWRIAAPLLLVLALGAPKISLFAKIKTSSDYGERNYNGAFEVMSYNIRLMRDENYQLANRPIAEMLKERFPSIVCLQECNASLLKMELDGRLVRYYNYVLDDVAILSRFKIIHKGEDMFPAGSPSHGRTQWVDLAVDKDTVRLFNLHLLTTNIQSNDEVYISSREFIADSLRENKLRDIAHRLTRQSRLRAEQVDTIAMNVAASPYPTIICGDFNDTPISYSYERLSSGMDDTFQEAGSGFPHTFRGFRNTLRIDYILTSEERFEIMDHAVEYDITFSDHHPITAKIKLK